MKLFSLTTLAASAAGLLMSFAVVAGEHPGTSASEHPTAAGSNTTPDATPKTNRGSNQPGADKTSVPSDDAEHPGNDTDHPGDEADS